MRKICKQGACRDLFSASLAAPSEARRFAVCEREVHGESRRVRRKKSVEKASITFG